MCGIDVSVMVPRNGSKARIRRVVLSTALAEPFRRLHRGGVDAASEAYEAYESCKSDGSTHERTSPRALRARFGPRFPSYTRACLCATTRSGITISPIGRTR